MSTITRFILENIYTRVTGGVFPPYFLLNKTKGITTVDSADYSELQGKSDEELTEAIITNAKGIPMVMPLQIKKITEPDSEYWTLPYEPLISITGKNVIVKRNVMKSKTRGTIKERWTQDDYEVNIQGILISSDKDEYPEADIRKLRSYCEATSISVLCPLLEIFNISRLAIEDYEFPFTTGKENQGYTIKGMSDDTYQLLLTGDDLKS
jgi:hypothetical protein